MWPGPATPERGRRKGCRGRGTLDGDDLGRRDLGGVAVEVDPLASERDLDVLARLVDPPLDRGEGHLERVADLRVGEPDDVPQEQRHLEVDVEVADGAPDRVDRLEPLERRVDDLEGRDLVEVDEAPRPALEGDR